MMHRPSKDQYYMTHARVAALRSTCLRRKVGAIIVLDDRIVSTGYNGSPRGLDHCEKCLREEMNIPSGQRHEMCRAVHAEQNAIIQSLGPVVGSTIYTTTMPCSICLKMIINAKIHRIVYLEGYSCEMSRKLISESNLQIHKLEKSKKR